jgi:uncharacterized protein
MSPNSITWIDIPVLDLDRAITFYSHVLGQEVKKEALPSSSIGIFAHSSGEVSACLFVNPEERPSASGSLIYLNVDGRLDRAIEETSKNGGKILKVKHSIEPYGYRAIILDSEGNRMALHSRT